MKTLLRFFTKSQRINQRVVMAVLAFNLIGCANLADTRLARQDLLDSQESNQALALKDLHFLANKGYADAKIVLAEYFARIGQPKHIDETDALFQRMIHVSYLYNKRYSNWLFNVAKVTPSYREKALNNLWQRMKTQGDVGPQIARLEEIFEGDASPIIDELFAYIDSQDGLYDTDKVQIIADLDDPSPWMAQVNTICSTSKYIEFYCLKSKIKFAKLNANSQLTSLSDETNTAYVNGSISASEASSLMQLFALNNEAVGFGSIPLAYESAKTAISEDDDVFLTYAKYEMENTVALPNAELISRLQTLSDSHPISNVLLARLYSRGIRMAEYPTIAKKYYEKALPNPIAAFDLGRLYLSGKLGRAEPTVGVKYLINAARNGQHQAYRTLSQTFSNGNGVKPNILYMHLFSTVYEKLGFQLTDADKIILEQNPLSASQRAAIKPMVNDELKAIVSVLNVK